MKCPRKDCNNEARKHPSFGVVPCASCQAKDPVISFHAREPIPVSRLHRVQEQRDSHAKDMLQPFDGDRPNPEFIKAYPKQVKNYYTPEQLKESGV